MSQEPARITIFSRCTAADPIEAHKKTFAATPRGAAAAWREMEETAQTYARIGRGVGRVIVARIGARDVTGDLDAIFFAPRLYPVVLKDENWSFLHA